MNVWRRFGLSDAAALVIVVLALVIGGAAYLLARLEAPTASEQVAVQPAADVVLPDALPERTDPEPQTAPTPAPVAPSVDVVRVSAEGAALIAGTSEPGSKVFFVVNGFELASAVTDDKGSFVGFFDIPASDGPNSVDVARVAEDGSWVSDGSILVAAVSAVPPPAPDVADDVAQPGFSAPKPETGPAVRQTVPVPAAGEMAPDPLSVPAAPETFMVEAPKALPAAQSEIAALPPQASGAIEVPPTVPAPVARTQRPAAPTIVIASTEGVEVMQPAPQPLVPNRADTENVVIDAISYNESGEVALEGRGDAGAFVRIYLDDAPVLTSPIEPNGSWTTPLPDVDAGVYTLRVDEIDAEGQVTSRVETPFQRETIAIAVDAPPTAVTVQPGSTLWAIAREAFGAGTEYVRVYEQNRSLIRDPDLIYPGQVFALPTD